jgi:hypothetical protein
VLTNKGIIMIEEYGVTLEASQKTWAILKEKLNVINYGGWIPSLQSDADIKMLIDERVEAYESYPLGSEELKGALQDINFIWMDKDIEREISITSSGGVVRKVSKETLVGLLDLIEAEDCIDPLDNPRDFLSIRELLALRVELTAAEMGIDTGTPN